VLTWIHPYSMLAGLTFWWPQGPVPVSHHPWNGLSSEMQLQCPSLAPKPHCDCWHLPPAESVSSAGGLRSLDPFHGPQTAAVAPPHPSTLPVHQVCGWTAVPVSKQTSYSVWGKRIRNKISMNNMLKEINTFWLCRIWYSFRINLLTYLLTHSMVQNII